MNPGLNQNSWRVQTQTGCVMHPAMSGVIQNIGYLYTRHLIENAIGRGSACGAARLSVSSFGNKHDARVAYSASDLADVRDVRSDEL